MSQATVDNFVTVVSVGPRDKPEINENINFDSTGSGYVTVLTIGDDENQKDAKDVTEEVIVYRLPGERLGFGLKFEGGTKATEFVKRLFIQSCAADSPASRVKCSWGKLTEGDEIIKIDSISVNTMTRIDCVRCLKDSNVAIKLLVVHSYDQENKKQETPPLIISAEEKRIPPPPPPVPPRKISRKLLKNLNNNLPKEPSDNTSGNNNVINVRSETSKQKQLQSPRGSVRSYNSPDVLRRDRRFSDGSLGPPDAEVYVDLFLQESTQSLSESDDTGSTISTVIDRFGSFPATTTSSFSGSLPSTPTSVQRQLDISNINIYEDDDVFHGKTFNKPIPPPREENNNIIMEDVNPSCFQDAPLSYGNESTKAIVPDEIDLIREEPIVLQENRQLSKKPPVPPRSRDTHLSSTERSEKCLENLPRLVDFVPKTANGIKEVENPTEIMKMFLENERYKPDFEFFDKEPDKDNYINGGDLYSSKWSLSSHLATIGEVEEEGSSDCNFNRSSPTSTPVVIVENTDKVEEKNIPPSPPTAKNEIHGTMETPPSDSRQPPDGHEFPEHEEIQFKKVSVNLNLINDKFLSTRREDSPQPNRYFIQSTSNTDLRPKMYESTEDLKYGDFLPEPSPLYTRSQSLTDVSSLSKKNTKWNQMYEQRRKGLSKLKGLVIPEAAESDVSPSVNLPEIKSQTPTMYIPVPKLDNFSSTETISTSDADLLRTSIVIPSWSPSTPSNLPKYSPAFKRKSLQVYPTSISKSESDYSTTLDFPIKYCDKVSPKGNKVNDDDLNPPKSLESISSPTRSDCSFDYISSSKKYSKSNGDTFHKQSGRIEDESDNDSAVSSSQSSYNSRYSPPSSPTRSCELNHYSKKLEEDERSAQNRLLKPSSVEAINRKNILASAKCRSGKDLKIGSPVIRRKQEESQQEAENDRLKSEEEEFTLAEPVYQTPPIDAIDLSAPKEKPEEVVEVKISEHKTTREYVKLRKEQVDKRNNETPTKVATTNIFLALNSSSLNPVQKKLPEEMKEIKPKDYLSTNSNSRRPGPINVKALKKNFENMNSPPPLPQKVPVFKSPEPRSNNKTHDIVTDSKPMPSFRNGIDRSIEKLDILPPKFHEKKPSEVDKKTVVLKTDPYGTSLGITLSGGVDESKDITVHRIKYSSIAYTDGRLKKGDKIISINGKSTSELSHAKAVELLKEPVTEFHIVIEEGDNIVPSPVNSNGSLLQRRSSSMSSVLSRTKSPSLEVIEERKANNVVSLVKDGAGLGFSIEGGRDSPQGNVPLLVKKIFTGGAAEKSCQLKVGDEIIQINDIKFTLLTRIEAWNAMKKIPDGKVEIHIFR